MKNRTTVIMMLAGLSGGAVAHPADRAVEFKRGESYWLVSDAHVDSCDVNGQLGTPAVAHDAPAHAIFRLVDTTAAGAAVIRFWKWKTDTAKGALFNDSGTAPNTTPRYFLLSKADLHKKVELQTDTSATNGQEDYDPVTEVPDRAYVLLGKSFLPLGRDRSFVYSLGTNFDFIENVQVSKTYHDIKVWVPRLSKESGRWFTPFGFEFMFNRFRTFSTPDSAQTQYRDVDGEQVIVGPDTTFIQHYITNDVKEKTTSRFDNLGLTLNPMYRLTQADRKDVMLAAVANLEWQRSTLNRTIDRTFETTDDSIPPADWPIPYNTTDFLPEAHEVVRNTTDNFYMGGGFRLMYRDDFGTLNLRAYSGYAYFAVVGGGKELSSQEAIYYALQAEIIEHKVSGVKLGCEIRGFFKRADADPVQSQPRFSLYIAKEFRLEKVGELFKP